MEILAFSYDLEIGSPIVALEVVYHTRNESFCEGTEVQLNPQDIQNSQLEGIHAVVYGHCLVFDLLAGACKR